MRIAELGRIRNALAKRHKDSAPAIESLELKGLPGFIDSKLNLGLGFLAICGGTGVGKTAFLELVYSALCATGDPAPRNTDRLSGCTISLAITCLGQSFTVNYTVEDQSEAVRSGYPHGARLISLEGRTILIQQNAASQDYGVVTEGLDFIEVDRKTRSTLSLICMKSYTAARYREIEVGSIFFPFFEVEAEGIRYDSRSMATGELSAFYIAWACLTAEPYGMILIEEPEAYLPAHSHSAIFGLVASFSLSKHLGIIFTTHSPSIAMEVPDQFIFPIRRANGKSLFPVGRESKVRTLGRLGMGPSRNVIFFVEDKLGERVLGELLGMFDFASVAKVEIVIITDGAGGVKKTLGGIPGTIGSCTFIGIIDGDMRAEAASWQSKHPIVFLPFVQAMETELLEVSTLRKSRVARELNRSEDLIDDSLERSTGKDLHDRFNFVAESLNVPEEILIKACFNSWLMTSSNRRAAQTFIKEVSKATRVELP